MKPDSSLHELEWPCTRMCTVCICTCMQLHWSRVSHLQFRRQAGQIMCWCHGQWVSKSYRASLEPKTVKESCSSFVDASSKLFIYTKPFIILSKAGSVLLLFFCWQRPESPIIMVGKWHPISRTKSCQWVHTIHIFNSLQETLYGWHINQVDLEKSC